MKDPKDTGYHAVVWNEPLLQELSTPGRRGMQVPKSSDEIRSKVGDVVSRIPSKMPKKSWV